MKILRKIITVDEEKCNGCGLCIPSCPEGAMQIVDTPDGPKARLVKESFCDGLGACLGECPQDALAVEEREVEHYDGEGVIANLKEKSPELLEGHLTHLKKHEHELAQHSSHIEMHACPSSHVQRWDGDEVEGEVEGVKIGSQLRQWPVQLRLVPPFAPYFQDADLILVADCVPFAYANFHQDFLKGNAVAIACPKLDDIGPYVDKIRQIIEISNVRSLTVVHMEVPCCYGLTQIAKEALAQSGKDIPFKTAVIGVRGEAKVAGSAS